MSFTKRRILRVSIIIVIIVFFLILLIFQQISVHKFWTKYRQLSPELKKEQVISIWGAEPLYYVKLIDGSEIWYYKNSAHPYSVEADIKRGAIIKDMQNIPVLYSYAELLFNNQGILEAYTCSGEEVYIYTIKGKFKGDTIKSYIIKYRKG